MQAHEAVGEALRWHREQHGWSQADVAERLAGEGLKLDPSAIARIERGERDVRVGELLALAAALRTTPAELVAPRYVKSLSWGDRRLSGAQVLSWFAGNQEALIRPQIKTLDQLIQDARESETLTHLVEQVAVLIEAIKQKDGPAVVLAAAYMHDTLGVMSTWMLSEDDLARIGREYDIPGPEGN